MKFIFCAAFSLSLLAHAETAGKDYGAGIQLKSEPIALVNAIKDHAKLKDKEILISAKAEKVCQEKGCWMTLTDGFQQIRVTFKGYSFFVPKDSAAKDALVQGKIFVKTISAAQARHYAKDEGKPVAEQEKIQTPVKSYWFEATGVHLN